MKIPAETLQLRINNALGLAVDFGLTDGSHHKMWVIDQMVRALTGCPIIKEEFIDYLGRPAVSESFGESNQYRAFTAQFEEWEVGIAP